MVNSLIDANTDGVIVMLDCAKGYGSVDHGYLENVLFCVGCPDTKNATMYDALHIKSLSIHSKHIGANVACESQWTMCTSSANL